MKHATSEALDQLEPLLEELRKLPLKEKKRGVFYLKSRAFLHFHEDPQGLFADVRLDGSEFSRFRVSTQKERQAFVSKVKKMHPIK